MMQNLFRTEITHTSIIDLTKGTPDKINTLFGKVWTIDLHLDESGTEVVGAALAPVELKIRWRIVDFNLVEEYTVSGKTFTTTSVAVEGKFLIVQTCLNHVFNLELTFDNEWVMSEITGVEAFRANFPPIPADQQVILGKLLKNEISMTLVIKTTGVNRYIRRKTG